MTLSERQAQIAEMVRKTGAQNVNVLSDLFGVTTQTIRRDLNILFEQGLVRRRHGGVERLSPAGNLVYSSRQILNIGAKQAIARAVADDLENGLSIAISIGTTPEIVAQHLTGHHRLRIFTNNIHVAVAASRNTDCNVHIAGGRVRNGDLDILGANTAAFFASYKVDIGIFGVGGVDHDGTLLDFDQEEAEARQMILANCRKALLVLDHSKFGRRAHVRSGSICDVDTVYCDRPPPGDISDLLRSAGTELVICKRESGP